MDAHRDMGLSTGLGQEATVNFGPGDPVAAHQVNEAVAIKSHNACTTALALALALERWWLKASTSITLQVPTILVPRATMFSSRSSFKIWLASCRTVPWSPSCPER
jgi:hypothetical protein